MYLLLVGGAKTRLGSFAVACGSLSHMWKAHGMQKEGRKKTERGRRKNDSTQLHLPSLVL